MGAYIPPRPGGFEEPNTQPVAEGLMSPGMASEAGPIGGAVQDLGGFIEALMQADTLVLGVGAQFSHLPMVAESVREASMALRKVAVAIRAMAEVGQRDDISPDNML